MRISLSRDDGGVYTLTPVRNMASFDRGAMQMRETGQGSEVRGQGSEDGGRVGLVCGCWDEVKGIILERLRLGVPKEMGRGECVQVGLTEVFTLWG
jgi:hypothetical protein